MMRSTIQALTLLGAAGLLTASPLAAQHSMHGGMMADSSMRMDSTVKMDTTMQMGERGMEMGGMMEMMAMMHRCSMMGAAMHGPQLVLAHRKQLGLSDAQVTKLEALQKDAQQAMKQAMKKMQPLHQQVAKATTGDQFNEQAARSVLQQIGALHTDVAVAMLRASHDAQRVLTPEQREALAKFNKGMMGKDGMMDMHGMAGMQGMTGSGMQGGMDMQGCSMMRGGMGGMPMHGSDSTSMQHQPQ